MAAAALDARWLCSAVARRWAEHCLAARLCPQVKELQAAILAGDWSAATKHVGRLELPSEQALQEARFIILEQAFLEALQAGQPGAALACLREQLAPLAVNHARLHQLAAALMGGGAGAAQLLAAAAADGGSADGEGSAAAGSVEALAASRHVVLRRLQVPRRDEGPCLCLPCADATWGVCISFHPPPGCHPLPVSTPAPCPAATAMCQAVIPPDLLLPERRLEELVEQALSAQLAACTFHNAPGARPSLLADYSCGTEQIPTCTTQVRAGLGGPPLHARAEQPLQRALSWVQAGAGASCLHPPCTHFPTRFIRCTQVLLDHADEVWHLAFSHSGTMLASCGKDHTALIWDVERRPPAAASAADAAASPSGASPRGGGGVSGEGAATVVRRHVLRGHAGHVAFLCWSPDDSKLATCGECCLAVAVAGGMGVVGGAACLCLLPPPSPPLLLPPPLPPLTELPALPLPLSGVDGLRLWDVASGRCLATLHHHKDPVRPSATGVASLPAGVPARLPCCGTAAAACPSTYPATHLQPTRQPRRSPAPPGFRTGSGWSRDPTTSSCEPAAWAAAREAACLAGRLDGACLLAHAAACTKPCLMHAMQPAADADAPCRCIVDLSGAVQRSWRIQRVQEVLVAKGGRYVLVRRAGTLVRGEGADCHRAPALPACRSGPFMTHPSQR